MTLFNENTMDVYDPIGLVSDFLNGVIENKELLVVVNGSSSNDSEVRVGYVVPLGYAQKGRITQIDLTGAGSINPFYFRVFDAMKGIGIQYISSVTVFRETCVNPTCYDEVVRSTEMFSGDDAIAKLHELNEASKESMMEYDLGRDIDFFLEQI